MSYQPGLATVLCCAAALALACASATMADDQGYDAQQRSASAPSSPFTAFETAGDGEGTYSVDYEFLNGTLRALVVNLGVAPRQSSGGDFRVNSGTRIRDGHTSRYRHEGARLALHQLEDENIAVISAYRRDLEALPGQIDFAALSRDEQLAYWLNLHNVTVIEQIALQYPVRNIGRLNAAGTDESLFEAKILTVAGVPLSLNDIRLRIVYPGWDNPLVIYGFFNGAVGGPNIRNTAYTARTVWLQLEFNAREFVNSRRGVELFGHRAHISHIYAEAAPYVFPGGGEELRRHLLDFTFPSNRDRLENASSLHPSTAEWTIADLSAGSARCGGIHRAPLHTVNPGADTFTRRQRIRFENVGADADARCNDVPAAAQRLVGEVQVQQALRAQHSTPRVIIRDLRTPEE